jgi:hypothetical protein
MQLVSFKGGWAMKQEKQRNGEIFSADYVVVVPDQQERVTDLIRRMYVPLADQAIDRAAIEEVGEVISRSNRDLDDTLVPGEPIVLPAQVGQSVIAFRKITPTPPELPKKPPSIVPEPVPPPDPTIPPPSDLVWDPGNVKVIEKGPELTTSSKCKGFFEIDVERDGTQERRIRSGSYIYTRRGTAPPVKVLGVQLAGEHYEVIRCARFIVRTWQLQRTSLFYVTVCPPPQPTERKRRATNEPVWVQLPDEEVPGLPEEVLAVFEGPKPITGTDLRDKAVEWAKKYGQDHPDGTTYKPELDGKGSSDK